MSGITGLAIHPKPFQALRETYGTTLQELKKIPSSAVYRQAAEAVTSHRLSLVEQAEASQGDAEAQIAQFEQQIDEAHCIEEVVDAAQTELRLVQDMQKWKAYARIGSQILRVHRLMQRFFFLLMLQLGSLVYTGTSGSVGRLCSASYVARSLSLYATGWCATEPL